MEDNIIAFSIAIYLLQNAIALQVIFEILLGED